MTDTSNPINSHDPNDSKDPKTSSEIIHPLTNHKGWGGLVGSTLGRAIRVTRNGLGSAAGAVGIQVGLVKKVVGGAVVVGISTATVHHFTQMKELLISKMSEPSLLRDYRRFCIAQDRVNRPFSFPFSLLKAPVTDGDYTRPVGKQGKINELVKA